MQLPRTKVFTTSDSGDPPQALLRQINELRPQPYQKTVKNRRVEVRIAKVGLTLCLGVWIGSYLQGGVPSVRYMGTQFAIAIIMAFVFVQDRGWAVDDIPVAERLVGVSAGVGGLMLTFWATRRVHAIADRPMAG